MARPINRKGRPIPPRLASTVADGLLSAEDKAKIDILSTDQVITPTTDLSDSSPTTLTIGTSGAAGTSEYASRADHKHVVEHGDLAGGTYHAVATETVAGFMSAADKAKLDGLSSTGTSGWGVYIWNESPAGLLNSSNLQFTLEHSPNPVDSLQLFKNGLMQRVGANNDFTLSGVTITFTSPSVPTSNDILRATYITGETFYIHVSGESPTGAINGVNDSFTLAYAPYPVLSLQLYKNGMLQRVGSPNDYTLSSQTITFMPGNIPQSPDILLAYYTRGVQL